MPIDETPQPHQTDGSDLGRPQLPRDVQPRRMHSVSTVRLWWGGVIIAVLAAGVGATGTGLVMTAVQSSQSPSGSLHRPDQKKSQNGQRPEQEKRQHATPAPTTQSENN